MKRMRVVTSGDSGNNSGSSRKPRRAVVSSDNPQSPNRLTENEKQLRRNRRYATTTSFGAGFGSRTANVLNSGADQFYSPQLSTDFLEKPQNLRERRAFYRFFYHTNEIVGRAVDVHSELPLSKLRLAFPKCKNRKQGEYVFKFFEKMCEDMKLFKSLIEISHEYNLFGNCVVPETLIRTPSGYVRADEVTPGMKVLTHKGRYRNVDVCTSRLADEILDISVHEIGDPLRVTSEHPIEVLKNGKFKFVPASDLTEEDFIRVTWPTETQDVDSIPFEDTEEVQSVNPVLPLELKIDEDFCYLLGSWLGSQWCNSTEPDSWKICFLNDSFGQKNRCAEILSKIFGSEYVKICRSGNFEILEVNHNLKFLEWWYRNFGYSSKNSKCIPKWIFDLPSSKLLHLIAGIIDSSLIGSVSIIISSEKLARSLRDIGFKCGIVLNYDEGSGGFVGEEAEKIYNLTVMDKQSYLIATSFSESRPPEESETSRLEEFIVRVGGDVAFKIRSISHQKELTKVYNFQVEEDHTFQANWISTHNCFVFAEDDDYTDNVSIEEASRRKEEARQRAERIKELGVSDRDPLYKGWKKLVVLPPDQVMVRKLPLNDDVAIEFVPDPETRKFITSDMPLFPDIYQDMADFGRPEKKYEIPSEIRDRVRLNGRIPLDTDPYTGSHVFHLARRKSQYEPLGQSQIERCVNTLVYLDKLRQAQTSIASRHMTPMRLVWAEDLSSMDVDYLREQVDMALMDPDYSIIANYEVHWEEMGSNGRLLDLTNEFEQGTERLLIGLGLTREVLTGEGSYAGSRVSLEIMNQQYLLFRELIQDYVENNLFKPVARKKGFVEKDEYGNETLIFPRLSFTRLAIRDNEQFFDAAFQLHQQGKISTELMLDILNIDPESTRKRLEGDMWTINDPSYNELMRNVYTNAATGIVEQTDLISKLADYMGLEIQEQQEEAPEGAARFASEDSDTKEQLKKIVGYFMKHPDKLRQVFKNDGNTRIPKNGRSRTSQNVSRERS